MKNTSFISKICKKHILNTPKKHKNPPKITKNCQDMNFLKNILAKFSFVLAKSFYVWYNIVSFENRLSEVNLN